MGRRPSYSPGKVLFDDSIEGWAMAEMFMRWGFGLPTGNLEIANDHAEEHPEKYLAWRAMMRIKYGDAFKNVPLRMVGHE